MPKAGTSKLEPFRDYIIKSYKSGIPVKEMAEKLGVTPNGVRNYLKSIGEEMNPTTQEKAFIFTDEILDKICDLWESGKSAYAISKIYKCHNHTISKKLNEVGYDLSKNLRKRDDPLINHTAEIVAMYNSGMGSYLIAKKFDTKDWNILKLLKKNGVESRPLAQYSFNEDFFLKIDNEFKSYTLGFVFADGSIDLDRACLNMCCVDQDVMIKIKSAMDFDGPISKQLPVEGGKRKQTLYSINIGRRYMINHLLDLGCGPRKTYKLDFPNENQVPKDLVRHFIRGFMDGDGSIMKYKDKYFIKFIGTAEMMNGLQSFIFDELDIKGSVYQSSQCTVTTEYAFGGNLQVARFLDWLYKDSQIHMDRKYLRYLELLEIAA